MRIYKEEHRKDAGIIIRTLGETGGYDEHCRAPISAPPERIRELQRRAFLGVPLFEGTLLPDGRYIEDN